MNRRQLSFQLLDQVIDDLEQLAAGYSARGNWNLAQTCGHLNDWMTFPMDGFPRPILPMKMILWTMKVMMGKRQLRKIIHNGFQPGTPTMPQTVPASDALEEGLAITALIETIKRFDAFDGPICPSPLFGEMDKSIALKLQMRHCEHHLSFLTPQN